MSDTGQPPPSLTVDEALRLMDKFGDQLTAEQLRAITERLGPTIPVADAMRFAHELDKRVTYRGLNAVQVEGLKKLTDDDWKVAAGLYGDLLKWQRTPASGQNIALRLALLVAAGIAYALLEGWLQTFAGGFAAIVAASTFINLERDAIHREGWLAGFENGVDQGVNRALGISRDESVDVHRRAIQMRSDEENFSRGADGGTAVPMSGTGPRGAAEQ